MNFLRGWKDNQSKIADKKLNSEFLQLKIFALTVQGNVLQQQNNNPKAKRAYQEAFKLFQENKISPNQFSILDNKIVESLHRELIELLAVDKIPVDNITENDQFDEVMNSLKQHLYDALEYSLKNQNWREADRRTSELMLFVANTRERDFLYIEDIENFSCSDLKKIDNYWVQNSGGRFGFSVQKQISLETRNRLGFTQPEQSADYENYLRFASRIGWYDSNRNSLLSITQVIDLVEKDYQLAPKGTVPSFSFNTLPSFGFTTKQYDLIKKIGIIDTLILFWRCDL